MTRVSTSFYEVAVKGRPLPLGLAAAVEQVTVDQRLMMPSHLSVSLFGADPADATAGGLVLGADLALTVIQGATRTPLFTGAITSVEVDSSTAGQTLRVRAHDALHPLTAGRRSAAFQQQTTSDIIAKVLGAAGVGKKAVTSTSVVHEHVLQVDESDYDLICRLALDAGLVVRIDATGKVVVEPVPKAVGGSESAHGLRTAAEPLALTAGKNVIAWRARVTQAEAVGEVVVAGWDPQTKRAVSVTAKPGKDLVANGATVTGSATLHLGGPVTTTAQATALAKAAAEEVGSLRAELEVEVFGAPKVTAGATVAFGKVGKPYDGRYVVTAARHRFDLDGYTTTVESTSLFDRSLLGTLRGGAEGRRHRSGPVIGVVTNAKDPEKRGRVKIAYPWLDEKLESDWARVLHHGAGPTRGHLIVPEVNDEVLVDFEHGDPDRAVVLGGSYNGKDKPEPAVYAGDGTPGAQVWRSVSGHRVELRDEKGKEAITITSGDEDVVVKIDKTAKAVTVTTKQSKVDVQSGGPVSVKSKQDVSLEGINVTIKGTNITLDAKAQMTLKGAGQAEVSSSGIVTVKGSLIKLN